jgi:NAD(P)-dependent dehydrogenase (short-subunit alcohol dehydrogenase family)
VAELVVRHTPKYGDVCGRAGRGRWHCWSLVGIDVRDDASEAAARDTIAAAGGLDVLVNNAGILCSTWPFAETTVDDSFGPVPW